MESPLSNMFGSMGKRLGASFMAGLSLKALVDLGKKSLELGSDLNEVQNVVDVTFGAMRESMNAWAEDAMTSFGLSETMAKEFAGFYGAMAKASGFAEETAYDMSTTLAGLAGDVASFYNLDQQDAYAKLKAIFTGETEGLKSIGVMMTQANLDQFALANGFGKTTSAMTEQEKTMLRYRYVLNALNGASGDFARTSGSWANQVRILKLQFESLGATLGQILIEVLTPAIQWLNFFMSKLVKAANTLKSFIFTLMGKDANEASGAGALAETLANIGSSGYSAAGGIGSVGDSVSSAAKEIKRGLMGFDQINKLLDTSSSDSAGGGSVGGIAGGLGDVSSAIQGMNLDLDSMEAPGWMDDITAKIEGWKTTFADTVQSVKDKWADIKSKVSEAWDNLIHPFKGGTTVNENGHSHSSGTFAVEATATVTSLKDAISKKYKTLKGFTSSFSAWKEQFMGKLREKQMSGYTAVITDSKDSIRSKILSGYTAAFTRSTDGLSTDQKTISTIARYRSSKDSLSTEQKTISTISKFVSMKDELKNKVITGFSAKLSSWTRNWGQGYNYLNLSAILTSWKRAAGWYTQGWDKLDLTARLTGLVMTSDVQAKLKAGYYATKANGGVFSGGGWQPIQAYASGGAPSGGQLFVAREAGPELVGTLGGHTAVMNNNQIVASVSAGVAKAISGISFYAKESATPQLAVIGSSVSKSEQYLSTMAAQAQTGAKGTTTLILAAIQQLIQLVQAIDPNVYLDGQQITDRVTRNINNQTQATGICPIIV